MKKPIAALAALVIAAGASVYAVFSVKDQKDKDDRKAAEKAADNILFNFDSKSVTKASFKCADGDYTAEYINDEWVLTSGGDFLLDQDYVTNVCTYVGKLKADMSFDNDKDKYAAYGLDDPCVIELFSGENSYRLNVGGISPTSEYYYITLDDRDRVYAVDSIYGSLLKTRRELLFNKYLVPFNDFSFAEIKVSKNGKTVYDLVRDPEKDTWSLPAEYSSLSLSQTSVDPLVTVLTRVRTTADGIRETHPSDLSVYGLDKPEFTADITAVDGTTRTLLINPDYDKENGYSSVYTKETDQVMLFPTIDLTLIKKTPFDFITKNITNAEYTDIAELEYTSGETKAKFTADISAGKGTLNGTEFSLADSTVKLAFQNLVGSLGSENIKAVDIDASPSLDGPLLTAVFKKTNGSELTYQLTDAGNGLCYVFINGKYTGALVNADVVSGKNSAAYFYDEFLIAAKMK